MLFGIPTSAGIFFGDYNNIAAQNGVIRPIWTRLVSGDLSIYSAIIDTSLLDFTPSPLDTFIINDTTTITDTIAVNDTLYITCSIYSLWALCGFLPKHLSSDWWKKKNIQFTEFQGW